MKTPYLVNPFEHPPRHPHSDCYTPWQPPWQDPDPLEPSLKTVISKWKQPLGSHGELLVNATLAVAFEIHTWQQLVSCFTLPVWFLSNWNHTDANLSWSWRGWGDLGQNPVSLRATSHQQRNCFATHELATQEQAEDVQVEVRPSNGISLLTHTIDRQSAPLWLSQGPKLPFWRCRATVHSAKYNVRNEETRFKTGDLIIFTILLFEECCEPLRHNMPVLWK